MKLRIRFTNLILILMSFIIGILLCEFGSRLLINPADYLSISMVPDEILGRVVPPNTSSFDAWGFRNKEVPSKVDIVAIGDSHTYGNCATMNDSWPYAVSNLTGLSIYNLGLGGYGPNQYYHLLQTRALRLKPKLILCGLYMGDDFENAFSITYWKKHWSFLRKGNWEEVRADIWDVKSDPRFLKGFRVWLSRNSLIYQLVIHGPILGRVKGYIQVNIASRHQDDITTTLVVDEKNIREAFRPIGILKRLNQKSAEVHEGMRITFELLEKMNDICRQNNTQFVVVIIPTKETVFAEFLEHNSMVHLGPVIDELILNERIATNELIDFFYSSGIHYIETLPALRRAVDKELYTRSHRDMHPGKNGYRAIAEAVAEYIKQN
ncbi:MAG: hypothetical protein KAI50_02250 [Desulfobacterales bacterium]|nr:hypothetical protein [Desulfobacterales bacterium]